MIVGLVRLAVILGALVGCNDVPEEGIGDRWDGPSGTLVEVWRDDFDGPEGSAPDATKWNISVTGNPNNQEKQFYTNRRENSFLDGNGNLVIKALKERYQSRDYTSARLDTRGLYEPHFGRVEARIRVPSTKGIWPAFWMLGSNFREIGWPECGEIDILELAGSNPTVIHGSLHGPLYSGTSAFSRIYRRDGINFADDYHVYAFEWTNEGMRWMVDEQVYHSRTRYALEEKLKKEWVFDQPFYIILNIAVGGTFDGDPDDSTQFPQTMLVDYVKVFKVES